MSYYIERDLNDMDEKITDLENTISDVDGILSADHVSTMKDIIAEWDCVRKHIVTLIDIKDEE